MKSTLALLLSFLLINPNAALAQTAPIKIAVVELKVPGDFTSRQIPLRTSIVNAFKKQNRTQLIPRSEIEKFKQTAGLQKDIKVDSEALSEARELLVRGKDAYTALKFSNAVSFLEEARRAYITHLHLLRSNRDLIDAHLYLGLSYAATEKMDFATEEFRRVVYLDPSRELSTREYSPKVVALFSKVKQEVSVEDEISVRVESTPSEANVFINGKASGITPLEITMRAGEYFFLVEKQGLLPWFKPTTLKRRIENVRVTLRASSQETQWSNLFGIRDEKAQENREANKEEMGTVLALGQQVGAQMIFLGEIQKEPSNRLLGQLYDVRTQDFSKIVMIDLGKDLSSFSEDSLDLVEALMGQIRSDGYVTPAKPNLNYSPNELLVGGQDRPQQEMIEAPAQQKKWYENWWIWPVVGAVGVGAFFGIYSLTQSNQSGQIVINNKGNF